MAYRRETRQDRDLMNALYLKSMNHQYNCRTTHFTKPTKQGEEKMSKFTVKINAGKEPEFPLSYSQIEQVPGLYEVGGRPEVLLVVTEPNPTTGKQVVLRFSNGQDNRFYVANGWNTHSFRRVSGTVSFSA